MQRGRYEFSCVADRFASVGKGSISFLLVGLGSYAIHKENRRQSSQREYLDLKSTYQIFNLISQLEQRDMDYSAAAYDVNPKNIELLETIEQISVLKNVYHEEEFSFFDYVNNCHITDGDIGMRFDTDTEKLVYYSSIPDSFKRKREDGEITTVVDSIANNHPELNNQFDLVVCTNVLDYLPINKQVYSLLNMKSYTKENGLIVMNGMEETFGIEYSDEYSPVIEDFGLSNISDQYDPFPEYLILQKNW